MQNIPSTTESVLRTTMEPELPLTKESTTLILLYGINCVIGIVGIVVNLCLIFVIYKNRNLHSACAFLIAYSSFCSILYQLLIFIPFLLAILPANQFLTREACFWIQVPAVYGTYGSMNSICAIGLDRFISVFFPLWYITKHNRSYLSLLVLLASAPTLSIYWLFWHVKAAHYPESLVLCTLGELMADRHQFSTNLTLAVNVATAALYICIWLKLKFGAAIATNNVAQAAILQSVRIIIGIQICGWVFVQLAFFMQSIFEYATTFMGRWLLAAAMNIFCCVITATDPVVLFHRSREYRIAFCNHFSFLKGLARKIEHKVQSTSNIAVQPAIQQNNHR